jgi:uncharacterized protein HemY
VSNFSAISWTEQVTIFIKAIGRGEYHVSQIDKSLYELISKFVIVFLVIIGVYLGLEVVMGTGQTVFVWC